MAIQWQNISAPNLSSNVQAINNANKGLSDTLNNSLNSFKEYNEAEKNKAKESLLNKASSLFNEESLNPDTDINNLGTRALNMLSGVAGKEEAQSLVDSFTARRQGVIDGAKANDSEYLNGIKKLDREAEKITTNYTNDEAKLKKKYKIGENDSVLEPVSQKDLNASINTALEGLAKDRTFLYSDENRNDARAALIDLQTENNLSNAEISDILSKTGFQLDNDLLSKDFNIDVFKEQGTRLIESYKKNDRLNNANTSLYQKELEKLNDARYSKLDSLDSRRVENEASVNKRALMKAHGSK